MEGGKLIMDLKTIVNQWTFDFGIRRNSSLRLLSLMLSYMVVKFGVATSLENCEIQKCFITYNLKIKGNTPYHILLIEVSLSPIESMAMTRYLMYKNKINNMEDKRTS
jgi:hypothetical protein